ncbi:hypothetical protein BD310DRAFT_850215 [Dichomitus squalens]|nr:hypothetical protein BD310DRAFT_850215 [Dichomitus squalens]
MRGPGSTAVSELLAIEDLVSLLGLSFKNVRELNRIVDTKLSSGRPRFIRREIVVSGESFEVFYRDVIQCIRALYGDPEFADLLVFAPERHYTDETEQSRIYFDLHTGKWWWETQAALEKRRPGATIIPIIISSDKTQLTLFGNRTAWPVYMTIGNLPKDVRRKPSRRGQILLAYLPSARLNHITNLAARRRAHANLFHKCMSTILKPLIDAGINGIRIASGDGVVRRGHPIFATFIGDYPEQLLVTCCKNGTCPKCAVPRSELGSTTEPERELRDLNAVFRALDEVDNTARVYSRACRDAGIKPVKHPFWEDLPYTNIFRSITPDVLHQLYQGVIKHLLEWLKAAYGTEEIDARCRRLPPNHQLRIFFKGISTLQRVTGKEHADICRQLLGFVVGLPLRHGTSAIRVVRAVRALLDFLYLAQYPAHTSDTLSLLQAALRRFHENKVVFVDLAIRAHFKFPKLHALDHYVEAIKLFGTTDNYDTQYTERLHIDFAKDAYRATNHRDEFPQMTQWLERREKILRHDVYIQWRLQRTAEQEADATMQAPLESQPLPPRSPSAPLSRIYSIAKTPNVKALRFHEAVDKYGATFLRDAIARFVVKYRSPLFSAQEVDHESRNIFLPFATFPAWHRIKFRLEDLQNFGIMEATRDAAHARPTRVDRRNRPVPARFDTVVVEDSDSSATDGIKKYRVGRLRLIFRLPSKACRQLFPNVVSPGPLAYIEWFTAFTRPDSVHGMYKVSRCRNDRDELLASVVEVDTIRRSCHLFPTCSGTISRDWTSSTVLDACEDFWLNPFSDLHMYMTLG